MGGPVDGTVIASTVLRFAIASRNKKKRQRAKLLGLLGNCALLSRKMNAVTSGH